MQQQPAAQQQQAGQQQQVPTQQQQPAAMQPQQWQPQQGQQQQWPQQQWQQQQWPQQQWQQQWPQQQWQPYQGQQQWQQQQWQQQQWPQQGASSQPLQQAPAQYAGQPGWNAGPPPNGPPPNAAPPSSGPPPPNAAQYAGQPGWNAGPLPNAAPPSSGPPPPNAAQYAGQPGWNAGPPPTAVIATQPLPVPQQALSPPAQVVAVLPIVQPAPVIIPKSFGPWSVICTVVKGYALPKMDLLGKIDAFVKVYSGRTFVCATKVVSKEYNPVWNHVCPPVLLQSYGEGVRFEVFDYDRGKDDDLVGIVALSTMELIRLASVGLPACATFDFTQAFKIPFKKNKNGGELTIRFQISWPPELIHLPMHAKVEALQTIQENKVFSFLVEKGITPYFMADLMSMSRFDIAFVCDDSGSMLASAGKRTRWEELQEIVKLAIEIGSKLDENGIDLLFLNREGKKNVKRFDEVASLFSAPPTGSTPLGPKCFEAFANLRPEKDLLVLIATDGVPDSLPGFKRVLENRNKDRIFVSILACSDNESEIGYLNELDRNVSNLDVLDDYESERREIKKKSPDLYDSYTVGNHVARLFVGPVFPKYDKLDESSK